MASRVLGVDPGTSVTGYGVVERKGGGLISVGYGIIASPPRRGMAARLETIYRALGEIIGQYRPDCLSVEGLFFAKNVQSALKLGQARGVALLAAAQAGLPLFEYSPAEIKGAVTGYGAADKGQVQRMVASLLGLDSIPTPPDAADALAVAICHLSAAALKGRIGSAQ